MHIRSRIGKAQNATPKSPQRRGERRRSAEDLPEGSFLSLLLCKVSALFASLRRRKLTRLAALFCVRCPGVIATAFQKWPARIFILVAAILAALGAGSRAWMGSENNRLSA